ncbi:MAG: hypothetical protein ACOVQX_00940 [Legionella sp.]
MPEIHSRLYHSVDIGLSNRDNRHHERVLFYSADSDFFSDMAGSLLTTLPNRGREDLIMAIDNMPSEFELDILKQISEPGLQKLLEDYEMRIDRLTTTCMISLEEINKDAIELYDQFLIVDKMYFDQDNYWKTIPNSFCVFSKSGFDDLCEHRGKHPVLRDSLLEPQDYNGCKTRYITYPYAVDCGNRAKPMTLELASFINYLKAYLYNETDYLQPSM